jgi:hypothetical protein
MNFFNSIRNFVSSVDDEYDRRIKSASNVKEYDPTGASHHHGHVEVHNEHVERVEGPEGTNGRSISAEPSQHQQSTPRAATHR